MLLGNFERFEAEAKRCLDEHLVHPAYDYVLKCSHTFNLLDARGAVSVTERAGYIARIRNLARVVAKTFVAERKRLGYHFWMQRLARNSWQRRENNHGKKFIS